MKHLFRHLKSVMGREKSRSLPFNLLFKQFRRVLEANNHALEVITDMGEKLGGDYLFDAVYIKRAFAELSSLVSGSLSDFDVLTNNRYLQLHDVFNHIGRQIERALSDVATKPEPGEEIIFFEDISWDMYPYVGGKNAGLAELKNFLKIKVPDAFAISAHAFDEFIRYNGLDERIEFLRKSSDNDRLLHALQNSMISAEIPPDLDIAIDAAVEKLRTRCGMGCSLAVRSSAEEEDGEFSFAGQFETLLNVPLDGNAVKEAYKKIVASLFSVNSMAYQKHLGYDIGRLKMAVGCMVMVEAAVSGVIYSSDPDGARDTMIINSAYGLGTSVVEGQTDADYYAVKKGAIEIIDRKSGQKEFMTVNAKEGTEKRKIPDELRRRLSLGDDQVAELARQAILIEKYFGKPQDIEWAIDGSGQVFFLQSRQLRIEECKKSQGPSPLPPSADSNPVLLRNRGIIVQKGVGAGRIFMLKNLEEMRTFPKGAILVARHDSSDFVRLMPYVSAIITDTGTPTSHMASLCREFRVPTVVNARDATQVLKHGQEITVRLDDEGIIVYAGIVRELTEFTGAKRMEDVYEYRKKRYVLRYISPLNLVDPLTDSFTVKGCKTVHDILRYIHEKSIVELVDNARRESEKIENFMVKLDLPIMTGIMIIDIGEGLNLSIKRDNGTSVDYSRRPSKRHETVTLEQVSSAPLKAVIKGMLYPGVWSLEAVSLNTGDLLTSMMRTPDIASESTVSNVAVITKEYVNLNLRFGYHFVVLDCYCSETARNNHIYFRFVGGATDITKRSRRVKLLADILKEYGFNIRTEGDLLIARLANISRGEMEGILDQLGRLIAYTRQMDALLGDRTSIDRYARNFVEGKYNLSDNIDPDSNKLKVE